jgi:hypothetical protein
MTDKLIMVTAPDDTVVNGGRITVVDLTADQTALVSAALTDIDSIPCIVTYVWSEYDDAVWVLDKIQKSQIIIFNADSTNQTLIGYVAGKMNSYYFGTLKSLNQVNNSVIYDVDHCKTILTNIFDRYGK